MPANEREDLLKRLDRARSHLEGLLAKVDPAQEIYPGWTIRQLLAHITGWDEDTLATLVAHQSGKAPALTAVRGFDEFNERTLSSRQDLDLDHVIQEWHSTRAKLKALLAELPEEKYRTTLVASWGERIRLTELIEVFIGHEEYHARDLREWLQNPSQPLRKKGN